MNAWLLAVPSRGQGVERGLNQQVGSNRANVSNLFSPGKLQVTLQDPGNSRRSSMRPKTTPRLNRWAFLLLITLMTLGASRAFGAGRVVEVTYAPSEKPGELVIGVTYRVWLPEGMST